jgi:anti-sigma regulatory factor (Ser/Thr protein kinase)
VSGWSGIGLVLLESIVDTTKYERSCKVSGRLERIGGL